MGGQRTIWPVCMVLPLSPQPEALKLYRDAIFLCNFLLLNKSFEKTSETKFKSKHDCLYYIGNYSFDADYRAQLEN